MFDGVGFARTREMALAKRLSQTQRRLRMVSVVFGEDAGSRLYTRLKFEAATRVGIEFDRVDVSLRDEVEYIQQEIRKASERNDVDGVLIQKPAKKTFEQYTNQREQGDFVGWWRGLTSQLSVGKDVDCLTASRLDTVFEGNWQLLPATVKAILLVLEHSYGMDEGVLSHNSGNKPLVGMRACVVGRSDIVGQPLADVLRQKGASVSMCGSRTEDLGIHTVNADILVAATGVSKLITADLVKLGAHVIDVGAPEGDVDAEAVVKEAAFLTPVPGGLGPVTVVSLLENLVELVGIG